MKKISALLILCILFISGCTNQGENQNMDYYLTGEITRIESDGFIIKSDDPTLEEAKVFIGEETTFINATKEELTLSSTIKIQYDGKVTRSIPPGIFALKIEKIEK